MAKVIDLQPIQEEHVSALLSFLSFMGANPKIDPDKDFVREDMIQPKVGNVKGANIRTRYIKLEGTNIDWIRYTIWQIVESGRYGGVMGDRWQAHCEFWVKRDVSRDKKHLKDLVANAEVKRKSPISFYFIKSTREVKDFKWVGGRIADILSQDTSLKEPLLADFINAQHTPSPSPLGIFTQPIPLPSDEEIKEYIKALRKDGIDIASPEDAVKRMMPLGQGVWITRSIPTIGQKQDIVPLVLPSKDAFSAYDRIAKHVKDFALVA